MTVAVVQPYFFPYAGYFRLFAAADTVVMFDCVQFPRRGWVHRNRFALANGELDWLTLPLEKAERDVRIDALRFARDAQQRLRASIHRFPLLEDAVRHNHELTNAVLNLGDDPTAYLCRTVEDVAKRLGVHKQIVRSSALAIDEKLRAQDRVIAIVRALGGRKYVNPSGGRELYDHSAFASEGIELRFLSPYQGSMDSILTRLLSEDPRSVARELLSETKLES